MVQTFGKRIIGGIGAPGGGMSKAYAEGVNTGIAQRMNRQSMSAVEQEMRMREQDQQFKIEDREEAKRQRAAAAAAAAAAKARSAALAKALAGTVGTTAPGVKIPPGRTYGPVVAVGGSTPATPKIPAAGAPVPQRPPLSFKLGAGGQQVSEAPMDISNIEFVQGTYDTVPVGGGRAGVRTAVAGAPNPMQSMTVPQLASLADQGDDAAINELRLREIAQLQGSAAMPPPDAITMATPGALAADTVQRQLAAAAAPVANTQKTIAMLQQYVAANPNDTAAANRLAAAQTQLVADMQAQAQTKTQVQAQAAPAQTRVREEQGPPVAPTVTIQGPNGPIVLPAEGAYSTGTVYNAEPAQLSFGPTLGAPQVDINASVVDRVAANPVGQAQPTPNAELYLMEPGRPGRELQQAYDTRDELLRQLNVYAEYGDFGAVRDLTTKINELDNSLYYLQGMQGIQELQFNSPQRLQMVLSEELGRDIGLQPNDQGGYDVYVDGMLAAQKDAGSGENSVSYWARSILDDNFATAEATRAEEYGKLDYQSRLKREEAVVQGQVNAELAQQKAALERESARIAGVSELNIAAIKRDLGLTNDDSVEFQKDETSGTILVFRNGELEAQYGPVEDVDSMGNTVMSFEQKY